TTDVEFLPAGLPGRLSLFRRAASYDAVFLQKRLLGSLELSVLRYFARRLVFDLDDAVMYDGSGLPDRRRQNRFRAVVRAADLVICGNSILADEVLAVSQQSPVVIPTAIDADLFHPRMRTASPGPGQPVTIGWTGSRSTARYLGELFPVLARLGSNVRLKVISDSVESLNVEELGPVPLEFIPWSTEVEVSAAATFDIGLMPLPDDPWTRGKCGFKALQYMSLGIPAVCSPVGANCEILDHGQAGFLPATADEWYSVLIRLSDNARLRQTTGQAGRQRIESIYDVRIQAPLLVAAVEQTCHQAVRVA
ncbi:MAG: glycosyltransferase family 4 protein, partial [Planctomycetaceae bacterium]|nr:glycosyltransferase family 4 protein [Planctomycetaceae bacterium]